MLGITNIGVEASKFAAIKNELGAKKTFAILLIERSITGFIKIFFIISAAIYFFKDHKYFFYLFSILLLFLFVFIAFIILAKSNNITIKYIKYFKNYFVNIISYIKIVNDHIFKIIFIGIACQFYNIFLYVSIFFIASINVNTIDIFLIVPLIELAAQIAIVMPAAQELATVALFSQTSLTFETAIFVALFYRIGDIFGIGLNTLFIEIYNKFIKS